MKVDDIWNAILEVEPTQKPGISLFENKKLHKLLDKLVKDDHKALRAQVEKWRDEDEAAADKLGDITRIPVMIPGCNHRARQSAFEQVLQLIDGKVE